MDVYCLSLVNIGLKHNEKLTDFIGCTFVVITCAVNALKNYAIYFNFQFSETINSVAKLARTIFIFTDHGNNQFPQK